MENEINISRRRLLRTGGTAFGAIAIVASGGVVYKALSEDIFSPIDGPAYQPWNDWNQLQAGAVGLVQVAILAANPHNTQPWRFSISDERIEVYADKARNLGSFDPFRREMHLGLGCAIENLALAAEAKGFAAEIIYEQGQLALADKDERIDLVATILLSDTVAKPNPLYAAIPHRHTNRNPYHLTELDDAFLDELQMEAQRSGLQLDLYAQGEGRQQLNQLVVDATQWIIKDPEMIHDSHRWFRNNKAQVEAHRDGPAIDSVGLSKPIAAIAKLLPETKAQVAHEMWEKATRENHLANAPIMGVISVSDRYSKEQSLAAGRYWQRLHLMATVKNIACHPMNQPVEWIDRLDQLEQQNIAEEKFQKL